MHNLKHFQEIAILAPVIKPAPENYCYLNVSIGRHGDYDENMRNAGFMKNRKCRKEDNSLYTHLRGEL